MLLLFYIYILTLKHINHIFNLWYHRNQAPEYNGEYTDDAAISGDDYFLDSPPPQALEDIKHVEQRADVRADVPKHAGMTSTKSIWIGVP